METLGKQSTIATPAMEYSRTEMLNCTHHTIQLYPIITAEEILKLAEIVKEEKMSGKSEEIDLKDKYQRRAEELALSEHNKKIDELDEDTQLDIYNRAEVSVGEELQLAADDFGEILKGE